jgi:hypothetical protein
VGFNEQFAGRILDTWWLTSRQSPQFASAQPRSADQPTTVATKRGVRMGMSISKGKYVRSVRIEYSKMNSVQECEQ